MEEVLTREQQLAITQLVDLIRRYHDGHGEVIIVFVNGKVVRIGSKTFKQFKD